MQFAPAARQFQQTADIHNGTLNLEDTISTIDPSPTGYGVKPDTSHTTGNPTSGQGSGTLTAVTRASGQAIMAQTFTGKMFNIRNNSIKSN